MTKVLVVDDESACRESLQLLLSTCTDSEVEVAANGREAIETGGHFQPDVLIVDWMLKDRMNGLEVAESLRAVHPDLRIIVITGFPSPELESRIKAIPGAQCLSKPFRPAELLAATEQAAAPRG